VPLKKKKLKDKKKQGKPLTEMTSDELAKHLFPKNVFEKLKEIVYRNDKKKK
jgi:hypothetical protein